MDTNKAGFGSEEAAAMGGEARAKSLTPVQRSAIARAAVEARWKRQGKLGRPIQRATHEGIMDINGVKIACAVLENGQRLITQSSFMVALGRARQAKGRQYYDADVNLPAFLTAKNLKPYIPQDLYVTSSQIEFCPLKGARAFGYPAELLPKVCEVYLKARDEKTLNEPLQAHIAKQCEILMRGLATIGIIALVDEATGFQDMRPRDALAKILEAFITKELRRWVKTFPPEFYKEMFRLKNWPYPTTSVARPGYAGKLTNDIVYERLAPGVLDELRAKNPPNESGNRPYRHHQWLTENIGHPKLLQHLSAVIALMKASSEWDDFYKLLNKALPKWQDVPLFKDLKD